MRNRYAGALAPLALTLWIAGGPPLALAETEPVFAGTSADATARGAWRLAQGGLSLDEIVARIEQRYKARVVRIETRQENGRTVYELRLLNANGKVWSIRVDADSGAVL